ncbi:hypothetical protein [Waltera sp.]
MAIIVSDYEKARDFYGRTCIDGN